MEQRTYKTKQEVLIRGQEAIGKTLGEIDKTGRIATGKGAVGTVIEESWFGYKPNSKPAPDFEEAGVELKVTPYRRTPRGIQAKERLVCDMLNYEEEYGKTFETSAFWTKCACMLLMSYEHKDGVPKVDFTIDKAVLFQFPDEDLEVIRNDWKILMDKIKAGQAHLISEGDTMYLAACPKGRNSQDTRSQPFSPIPAMKRAYSLKSSYMTQILRRYIFGDEPCEKIIKDPALLRSGTFEERFEEMLRPYIGKSCTELKAQFGITSTAKNINELLLAAMLGLKGRLASTDEFQKASIVPKTIAIEPNGTIKESMSFPVMNFCAMMNETWEESTLYNLLAPTKFLFIIFQKTEDGECYFQRIKFWNIPADDLEEVHHVWQRTVDTLREGVHIWKDSRGRNCNNLPKASESRVAHVRPHGIDSTDTAPLPTGGSMTKQCFWLNNSYVRSQIEN